MAEADLQNDEISLVALATVLLRKRWRIARWMFGCAIITAALVIFRPTLYRASASFVPQGGDATHAGLESLAGRFGVTLPGGRQSLSPEFYSKLLESRVILEPIVRDTFVVPEVGAGRVAFLDLFKIKGKSEANREERGEHQLESMVSVSVDKQTGVVGFSATTKWRSASLAIVTALLNGVNNFNERTRQGQAGAERRFVERRLVIAKDDLRDTEDRLERFLQENKEIGSSPRLMLEQARLQRAVSLRQQVFTSLTQSYEDARIREVRDTPVITVFEPPSVPALPEPRGRLVRVLLGFLLGGFIGVSLILASEMMSHYRSGRSVEASELVRVLEDVKGDWRRFLFWRSR